jgi:hypothetical protein
VDLYAYSGRFLLRHEEFAGSRLGYAEYDPNTHYFTCRTCGFELPDDDVGPCPEGSCPGRLRYDRYAALVCTADQTHLFHVKAI